MHKKGETKMHQGQHWSCQTQAPASPNRDADSNGSKKVGKAPALTSSLPGCEKRSVGSTLSSCSDSLSPTGHSGLPSAQTTLRLKLRKRLATIQQRSLVMTHSDLTAPQGSSLATTRTTEFDQEKSDTRQAPPPLLFSTQNSGNSAGVLDFSRLDLTPGKFKVASDPHPKDRRNTSSLGLAAAAAVGIAPGDDDSLKLVFEEVVAMELQGRPLDLLTNTANFASNTRLGVVGVTQLLAKYLPLHFPHLVGLDLIDVGFTDACMQALLDALGCAPSVFGSLPHCCKLKLGDNSITAAGVDFLVKGLTMPHTIEEGGGGPEGGGCQQEGIQASLPPPSSSCLRQLHLGGNALGDEGVSALGPLMDVTSTIRGARNPHRIEHLGLRSVGVGSVGMSALSTSLSQNSFLSDLQLRQNPKMGDAGISALCGALGSMSGLTSLDLKEVGMGSQGWEQLALALHWSPCHLRTLNLSENNLSGVSRTRSESSRSAVVGLQLGGAEAMAGYLSSSTSLTVLTMQNCELNSELAATMLAGLLVVANRKNKKNGDGEGHTGKSVLTTLSLNGNNLCPHRTHPSGLAPTDNIMSVASVLARILGRSAASANYANKDDLNTDDPIKLSTESSSPGCSLLSLGLSGCGMCSCGCIAALLDPVVSSTALLKHLDLSANFSGYSADDASSTPGCAYCNKGGGSRSTPQGEPSTFTLPCGVKAIATLIRSNTKLVRLMINDNHMQSTDMMMHVALALEGGAHAETTTTGTTPSGRSSGSGIRYLVFGGQSRKPPLANVVPDALRMV